MILRNHSYVFEPMGADSPSQTGAVEIYNDKFAVQTCTLLYGAGLPAKFWSSALLHAIYLHNRRVHSSTTKRTPLEGYFGTKPDLGNTILVKVELWELVIVFNNNFYSATNLCLRYASAKCGR